MVVAFGCFSVLITSPINFKKEKRVLFNALRTRNPYTGIMTNSEDSDEMPHSAAFHHGLQRLLTYKQNRSSEKEIIYIFFFFKL